MKKFQIISLLMICLALSACSFVQVRGSGTIATDQREIANVTGVTLATVGDLTVELGDEEALRIEAEDNLLPYIRSEVKDGMLTIEVRSISDFQPTKPIRYFLTVKELDTIINSSQGSIHAPQLRAKNFSAQVSSAGNVNVQGLDAETLDIALNSTGNLVIGGGEVETQEITLNSGGSYQAGDLRSRAARVEINSLGEMTIWVMDLLDAHLTSSGSLSYYGDPKVTSEVTSLGKLIPLGTK
jgi:hypothetical protein